MACARTIPGRDRVGEGRQRNSLTPAADPRADADRGPPRPRCPGRRPRFAAPRPARHRPGRNTSPVGGQVIKPAADQTERHRPQRDVVDDAALRRRGPAQRRSPIISATTIPAMMHSAYARIGNGPRCQTPCGGLGNVGQHRHDVDILCRTPSAKFLGQRAQLRQSRRQRRHQRRADDDTVGIAADLGGLLPRTHAQARRRRECRRPP